MTFECVLAVELWGNIRKWPGFNCGVNVWIPFVWQDPTGHRANGQKPITDGKRRSEVNLSPLAALRNPWSSLALDGPRLTGVCVVLVL